jgi:hypothetical protein
MRYLTLKKNGTWYFRFQIPIRFRSYFGNKIELKRSIGQVDRKTPYFKSLKLQLQVKEQIAEIESGMSVVESKHEQVHITKPLTLELSKTPSNTQNGLTPEANSSCRQDAHKESNPHLAPEINAIKIVVEPKALQSAETSLGC